MGAGVLKNDLMRQMCRLLGQMVVDLQAPDCGTSASGTASQAAQLLESLTQLSFCPKCAPHPASGSCDECGNATYDQLNPSHLVFTKWTDANGEKSGYLCSTCWHCLAETFCAFCGHKPAKLWKKQDKYEYGAVDENVPF